MFGKTGIRVSSRAEAMRYHRIVAVIVVVASGFYLTAGTKSQFAQARPASTLQELALAPLVAEPSTSDAQDQSPSIDTSDLGYTFNLGDRVKISVYGRDDLPSEYRVNAKGQIAVPTVGIFTVTSETPQHLEAMIASELQKSIDHTAFVTVEPLEPVFVTGLVSKPGAYPYSDGMIAIQAMTLAGGILNAASSSYLPTEAIREAAHMRSTELELAALYAARARLTAIRDRADKIVAPQQLIGLVGRDTAEELIAREQRLLEQDLLSVERQRQSLATTIREARTEIAAYEDETVYINEQRKLRVSMVEPLQALAKKGLTTQQRVADSELMLVSIERDAQNAIANLSRARQALERSERDLVLLDLDRSIQTEKLLRDSDEQIAKALASREGSARFVSYVSGMPVEAAMGDVVPTLEIMRKKMDGKYITLIATEQTQLMPGDVLKIGRTNTE